MKPSVFVLVDCNKFYASCETVWRPDLKGRPVVVLSNNDGCVIAMSKEAKAAGVKMGVPAFQINDQIRAGRLVAFSSNYALYGDISARVMRTLEEMAPRVEVYSIDECFLDLTGTEQLADFATFGHQVRERIQQWHGIGVGVGISSTKTLAKLANRAAKDYPATKGVVDLTDPERQQRLLPLMPVDEVWGIGRRLAARFKAQGIATALDLARCDPESIKRAYSVTVARTVAELQGTPCFGLEESPEPKKQIVCSRSFGARVRTYQAMREAVSSYAARAAEKLRGDGQEAQRITVFLTTSPFAEGPRYSNSASTALAEPTDDTRALIASARRLLETVWRDGYDYQKAGVMLAEFRPAGQQRQADLFSLPAERDVKTALMAAMDRINNSGAGRVWLAAQGQPKGSWTMKRRLLSPAYTTRWADIPRVR